MQSVNDDDDDVERKKKVPPPPSILKSWKNRSTSIQSSLGK